MDATFSSAPAAVVFKSLTSALNSAKQESKFISTVSPIRPTVNCFDTLWKPTKNNVDSCYKNRDFTHRSVNERSLWVLTIVRIVFIPPTRISTLSPLGEGSFIPQSQKWVNLCRSSGRQIARQQCNHSQHKCYCGEGLRIVGTDAEQQAAHKVH